MCSKVYSKAFLILGLKTTATLIQKILSIAMTKKVTNRCTVILKKKSRNVSSDWLLFSVSNSNFHKKNIRWWGTRAMQQRKTVNLFISFSQGRYSSSTHGWANPWAMDSEFAWPCVGCKVFFCAFDQNAQSTPLWSVFLSVMWQWNRIRQDAQRHHVGICSP